MSATLAAVIASIFVAIAMLAAEIVMNLYGDRHDLHGDRHDQHGDRHHLPRERHDHRGDRHDHNPARDYAKNNGLLLEIRSVGSKNWKEFMAKISIPIDRNSLAALAMRILEKNRTLAKTQGVSIPKKHRDGLKSARKVQSTLEKVDRLRAQADELAKSVDPELRVIKTSVRNIGQSILRQTSVENVKKWGFKFGR